MSEAPAPGRRPATWTAFGIINIVFAIFGLIGTLVAAGLMLYGPRNGQAGPGADTVTAAMSNNAVYSAYTKISLPLGALAAGVLLAGGIGLLKSRSWGRVLSLLYGWYGLIAGTIGLIVGWIAVSGPMLERAASKEGVEHAALIGGAIGGMIGGAFALIYPTLLIIFMRKDARAASGDPAAPADPANPYQAPRG